jgi:CRP/FNR family transcriptional regulator, cyclic AMP receptor protein
MQLNYQKLTEIPIFLGLSDKDLVDISRTTRFNLRHHKKGSTIVEEGDACSTLISVVDGWIEIDTYADNRSYHLEEIVQATQILEPDKLFGLSLHYHSTCRAYTTCESISISKEELMLIFDHYMIVRLNYLNLICRRAQKLEHHPWQQRSTELTERIVLFLKQHSLYPAGRKVLHIKMSQLANELNVSRLDVSNALNAMNKADKIIQRRGMMEIPSLQLL